jgi:hypothetical protein
MRSNSPSKLVDKNLWNAQTLLTYGTLQMSGIETTLLRSAVFHPGTSASATTNPTTIDCDIAADVVAAGADHGPRSRCGNHRAISG